MEAVPIPVLPGQPVVIHILSAPVPGLPAEAFSWRNVALAPKEPEESGGEDDESTETRTETATPTDSSRRGSRSRSSATAPSVQEEVATPEVTVRRLSNTAIRECVSRLSQPKRLDRDVYDENKDVRREAYKRFEVPNPEKQGHTWSPFFHKGAPPQPRMEKLEKRIEERMERAKQKKLTPEQQAAIEELVVRTDPKPKVENREAGLSPWLSGECKGSPQHIDDYEKLLLKRMQNALSKKLTPEQMERISEIQPQTPPRVSRRTEKETPWKPCGSRNGRPDQRTLDFERNLEKRMETSQKKKLTPEQQEAISAINVITRSPTPKSPRDNLTPWQPPGRSRSLTPADGFEQNLKKRMEAAMGKKLTPEQQQRIEEYQPNKVPRSPRQATAIWHPSGYDRADLPVTVLEWEKNLEKRMKQALEKKLTPEQQERIEEIVPPATQKVQHRYEPLWKPAGPQNVPLPPHKEQLEKDLKKRMDEARQKKIVVTETDYPYPGLSRSQTPKRGQ
eukprot:TRINITY_DN3715_c0_g1_i1.p1 TRINITY_DN3715_c0_g1~~TRINITY_DN3715_c0_g1_i1.p1  ORF type:complete len:506 (-),score=91.05 TRINITY_DN3715_c0_g1_i1:38-1555(-)